MSSLAIYELCAHGEAANNNYWLNTFKYHVLEHTGNPPFRIAKELVEAWISANQLKYKNCLPTNCVILGYTCRRIHPALANTHSQAAAVVGADTGEAASAGVGADIAFIADGSTLASVGHVYLPAVSIESLIDGRFTDPYIAILDVFAVGLRATITGDSFDSADLTIYHAKTHTDDVVTDHVIRPKPVLLNKRLQPVQ